MAVVGLLVTYRRAEPLAEHLRALAAQLRPPDRLIVIDNARDSSTKTIVNAEAPNAEYVAADDNLGPAGGLALGQKVALAEADSDDWLLHLDDDDPPWHESQLDDLVRTAEAERAHRPRLAAIGVAGARLTRLGRLHPPTDEELRGAELVAVDYLGGNQLPHYLAAAVRDVGPMRGDLFFGCEELEFGLRLRDAGWLLGSHAVWLKRSRDRWADVRGATGDVPSWRQYYNARNGVRVFLDHGRRPAAAGFVVSQLSGGVRQVLHTRRVGGFVSRASGIRDAARHHMGRTLEPGDKA